MHWTFGGTSGAPKSHRSSQVWVASAKPRLQEEGRAAHFVMELEFWWILNNHLLKHKYLLNIPLFSHLFLGTKSQLWTAGHVDAWHIFLLTALALLSDELNNQSPTEVGALTLLTTALLPAIVLGWTAYSCVPDCFPLQPIQRKTGSTGSASPPGMKTAVQVGDACCYFSGKAMAAFFIYFLFHQRLRQPLCYRLICLLQFCLIWLIFWKSDTSGLVEKNALPCIWHRACPGNKGKWFFFSEQLHILAAFLTAGKNVLWLSYWGFHCTSQCIN